MNPVLVFQHVPQDGPGHLAVFFERRGIPYRVLRTDAGEPVPADLHGVSGLALLGGPMSANDPLPWISPLLALIRRAVAEGVPVLGHCLGGQLMARALGAAVTRNPVPEIGWFPVEAVPGAAASDWLGPLPARFEVFHWHGETFGIPPGAQRLLASAACSNQAFASGPHLALQCHVEMTPGLVESWATGGGPELEPSHTVQSAAELLRDLERRSEALHRVADALYTRWSRALPG